MVCICIYIYIYEFVIFVSVLDIWYFFVSNWRGRGGWERTGGEKRGFKEECVVMILHCICIE